MHHAEIAQAPHEPNTQDRAFVTPTAAVVLDGATAHLPVDVSPEDYVDTLAAALRTRLDTETPLTEILALAIADTTRALTLTPGSSPSSTVAIARTTPEAVDVLVLGDSQVAIPNRVYRDDRLASVAAQERHAFERRLREGSGYDAVHARLLQAVQAEERLWRNTPGGYWIAETDSRAAHHAVVARAPRAAAPWLVLATDGAWEPMGHLGLANWAAVAHSSRMELEEMLAFCDRWESEGDPDGVLLPRSKRHDDKTLLVVHP